MGAQMLAHELAHLAGLFHTSAAIADDLDDTPQCALDRLGTDPMSCPDADKLLFPMVFSLSQPRGVLSPLQRDIIAGSLLYRAIDGPSADPDPAIVLP